MIGRLLRRALRGSGAVGLVRGQVGQVLNRPLPSGQRPGRVTATGFPHHPSVAERDLDQRPMVAPEPLHDAAGNGRFDDCPDEGGILKVVCVDLETPAANPGTDLHL